MTRDERDRIRCEIDRAKRARLQRARLGDATDKRREYWRDYHQRNRDRILATRKARAAHKAAA